MGNSISDCDFDFAVILWVPSISMVLFGVNDSRSDLKNRFDSIGFYTHLVAAIFRVAIKIAVAIAIAYEPLKSAPCKRL